MVQKINVKKCVVLTDQLKHQVEYGHEGWGGVNPTSNSIYPSKPGLSLFRLVLFKKVQRFVENEIKR